MFKIGILLVLSSLAWAKNPSVEIKTSKGTIVVELDQAKAPRSVKNFRAYVKDKFYDGTIFHRVIGNFMIQGGGFTADLNEKPTKPPVRNEANNGLKNDKYTIAMARTPDPHSATAQFFINVKDNDALNFKSEDPAGWGYAVFGKVTKGSEVVDAIKAVKTTVKNTPKGIPFDDVPEETVKIESIKIKK